MLEIYLSEDATLLKENTTAVAKDLSSRLLQHVGVGKWLGPPVSLVVPPTRDPHPKAFGHLVSTESLFLVSERHSISQRGAIHLKDEFKLPLLQEDFHSSRLPRHTATSRSPRPLPVSGAEAAAEVAGRSDERLAEGRGPRLAGLQ